MNNFISKLVFFIKNTNKKNLLNKKINPKKAYLFLIFLFFFFILTCHSVHAQDSVIDGVMQGVMQAFSWWFLSLAQLCIALTIFFLRLFITIASYNNFIDTNVVKIGWYMVRDVANMFFIVALLVIAFATILGIEKYEWKKSMVKLVIMAVLINFSNMIAQLIIDVAHIFTITFLNAISATAGGNLINMLSMDKITEMVSVGLTDVDNVSQLQSQILAASAAALLFAGLAAISIGAYCIIMLYRLVILWALIILSPLAYLFSAMPATEKYAKEWWKEFLNYVTVAPMMVFFLWLAFATLGSGDIITQLNKSGDVIPLISTGEQVGSQHASLSAVTEWENMANFLIAIVFLMVGLKKVKESGVEGAGAITKAMDYGKTAARYATGYAAGRWAVGKGYEMGKGYAMEKGAQIATPLMVLGKNIKSKIPKIGNRARDKAATEWEEKGFKFGRGKGGIVEATSRVLGWGTAQFWQTRSRGRKKVEDAKNVLKNLEEIEGQYSSTSKTMIGKMKTKTGAKLQDLYSSGASIKEDKEEKARQELLEKDPEYKARIEKGIKSRESADKIKTELENKKTKMRTKLATEDDDFSKILDQKQIALGEKGDLELEEKKNELLRRAVYYESKGTPADNEMASALRLLANAVRTNKVEEIWKKAGDKAYNANESAGRQASLTKDQSNLLGTIVNNTKTRKNLSAEDKLKYDNITRDKTILNNMVQSRGAYDAEKAMEESLKKTGHKGKITDENKMNIVLGEKLGFSIPDDATPKELSEAWDQWYESLGPEKEAILRQHALSSRNQIAQYNGQGSILYDEVTDPETGRIKYEKPNSFEPKIVKQKYYDRLKSWQSASNIDGKKANSAEADREWNDAIKEYEISVINKSQAELNAGFFKGATSQSISNFSGGIFGDLNSLKDRGSVERQLKEFAKVLEDEKAFKQGIKARLKDAISNVNLTDAEIDDIWNNIHPSSSVSSQAPSSPKTPKTNKKNNRKAKGMRPRPKRKP